MKKDIELEELINFQYMLNHKNYGFSCPEEKFELNYEGLITKLYEPTYPKTIGNFELTIYRIYKARKFNKLGEFIEMVSDIINYSDGRELNLEMVYRKYSLEKYDSIIYLKNCTIHPDWRGKGIFNELIKSIYLTHITSNTILIVNSSPIQNNDSLDFYTTEYPIDVYDGNGNVVEDIYGRYYKLNDLPVVDEINDYKLYNKMINLGFNQYDDLNLFSMSHENFEFLKL